MPIDPVTATAAAGTALQGLGSVFSGGDGDAKRQERMMQEQLRIQGRQSAIDRDFQAMMIKIKALGQGDINKGLQALMEQFKGGVYEGIQTGAETEKSVQLQTQALQPRLQGLAGKLASEFNLSNPAAQVALGKEAIAGEQRIRADANTQVQQQRFAAQQNMKSLLAQLQSQMGSTRTIGNQFLDEIRNLSMARYG